MANEHQEITLTEQLTTVLLARTLESWRFLLLMVAPPLLWVIFTASSSLLRAAVALVGGICIYGCWRLWLDVGYLTQFGAAENQQAGKALAFIWPQEQLSELTFSQRQYGALCQLKRTLLITALLWALWLFALILY
ncbi:hypothetical protein C9426_27035 [Serratia sp. S1B]|nr:hypothetical protein C9426_27035 [Serratia sp. S1B]